MTEQQIEQLKQVLSSSELVQSPKYLDEAILTDAKMSAPEKEPLFGFKRPYLRSFRFVSPALASVMLTIGLFFGMGQILKVGDQKADVQELVQAGQINRSNVESSIKEPAVADERIDIEQPVTLSARDQILVSKDFPAVSGLLNEMEFSASIDRDTARVAMLDAMEDIRFMIVGGEFDDARERYERLRRSCSVCDLPDTLESLVLNSVSASSEI